MAILHPDAICPYCLQSLRRQDLRYVCPLCRQEAVPTKMEIMLGRIPRCGNPGCHGNPASEVHCGHCNAKLPADILDYPKYLRFSILGVAGTGKTTFLTTMLHELRNTPGSPLVLMPMDGDTAVMYQNNDRRIYEYRRNVDANPPGLPPSPQQWRIRDRSRMTNTYIPSYSLTIFDGAGEDCAHIDPLISRYISGSKVLIILIDPLSLPGVSRTITEEVLNWSTSTEHDFGASADMVDGLANYIRESLQIKPGKLIDRNVAVVFTKIDAVQDSFGAATVMQPSPHMMHNGFVTEDSDAVNAEIRDWLEAHGETAFLNAIDTNFRADKVRFFGVSSFGQLPIGEDRLGQIMPHRILDPLMWMLARENIIPTL